MTDRVKRIAILASGNGTNAQLVMDACAAGAIEATVELVLTDVQTADVQRRAYEAEIPSVIYVPRPLSTSDRRKWDANLANIVDCAQPDFIVLAGFMRVLSNAFLNRFPNQVINLHPALPGELAGTRAIERAFSDFLTGARSSSGVMVHRVIDECVDDGPVLAQVIVPLFATDDLETFTDRMHAAEHRILCETLRQLCARTS